MIVRTIVSLALITLCLPLQTVTGSFIAGKWRQAIVPRLRQIDQEIRASQNGSAAKRFAVVGDVSDRAFG